MSKCLFDEKKKNPILAELAQVDVYNMTLMQAMNLLLEWKLTHSQKGVSEIFSELIVGWYKQPSLIYREQADDEVDDCELWDEGWKSSEEGACAC